MKVSIGDVVLPGDYFDEISTDNAKSRVVIGPGLRKEEDHVYITKAGVLKKKNPHTYWIDSYQKRVDIGGSTTAALSYLSFEGATKKNRPEVQVGDIIYAKLVIASKDMEPELVCIDSFGHKGRLGVLTDGFVFKCSINLIRKILSPQCPLLESLKNEWPFELAAGMNGRIWIKANSMKETIALGNAVLGAEFMSQEEIKKMSNNISATLAGHVY
ncbi:jg11672 [Pararge aegeria aegeria]|uniref:Ribosomal RNA-processing protein 40 n=1 Tax=Pararge aegeria aegeria TaxID=348720 RepID=A0A8S4S9D5_9NEOP|nr:jg11672 [Pararge aegeria aegeria]